MLRNAYRPFKMDERGLGYYRDGRRVDDASAEGAPHESSHLKSSPAEHAQLLACAVVATIFALKRPQLLVEPRRIRLHPRPWGSHRYGIAYAMPGAVRGRERVEIRW